MISLKDHWLEKTDFSFDNYYNEFMHSHLRAWEIFISNREKEGQKIFLATDCVFTKKYFSEKYSNVICYGDYDKLIEEISWGNHEPYFFFKDHKLGSPYDINYCDYLAGLSQCEFRVDNNFMQLMNYSLLSFSIYIVYGFGGFIIDDELEAKYVLFNREFLN